MKIHNVKNRKFLIETRFFFLKTALLILIVLGIGLMFREYWENHQKEPIYNSLLQYENILKNISENKTEAFSDAEKFIMDNKNIYGTLTSLIIAKKYVENNQLDKAEMYLHRGINSINDSNLRMIIGSRLSRIRVQQKKENEALKMLDSFKEISSITNTNDIQNRTLNLS